MNKCGWQQLAQVIVPDCDGIVMKCISTLGLSDWLGLTTHPANQLTFGQVRRLGISLRDVQTVRVVRSWQLPREGLLSQVDHR